MLGGRVVFGLGGENLAVASSAIISSWFMGKELSFAMGVNISIGRLGSVIGAQMFPALFNSTQGLPVPLLVGAILCAFSCVCAIGLCYLDKKAD